MKGFFHPGFLECRLLGSEALIEFGVKGLGPALAVGADGIDISANGSEAATGVDAEFVLIFPGGGSTS
jgi:hypothetical protein